MSARGFASVGWVAGVAATALGCYMVSLQVASTRASLEDVETQIVVAQRDIRVLQTEIGTRGRLAQLEQWNVKVLALSAPQANQFLDGEFQLATMVTPKKTVDPAAPVVLASAPAPSPSARPLLSSDADVANPAEPAGTDAKSMMHIASFKRDLPAPEQRQMVVKPVPAPAKAAPAKAAADAKSKAADKKTAARPPAAKTADNKSAVSSAPSKSPAKPAAKKVVDKPIVVKTAAADTSAKAAKPKTSQPKVDPLAPKPAKSREAKPKQ
ncbi:hypothetical protein [Sphingomonas arenae]|uniref:hypothetical protein n=1 Tax=Sphingomonas arenae TaxID=2812555 RepID=UPI0019688A62|nr:hypothetical protein [Sphingomonas arenae]